MNEGEALLRLELFVVCIKQLVIFSGTLSWATGDGIGGTELRIYGTSSKEDCYARCRNTKVNGVYANGATTDKKTNKLCYCEFGMTKRNAVAKWTSTFIARGMSLYYLIVFLYVFTSVIHRARINEDFLVQLKGL